MVSRLLAAAPQVAPAQDADLDTALDSHLPRATLSDVTDAVLKILRPDLKRRGSQFVVEVTETSEFLDGDPCPVAQVLADLLESVSRRTTYAVMMRVALERGQVVITARAPRFAIDLELARRLTERYGRAISCCVTPIERGSQMVVRVRVPVVEFESAAAAVAYDWQAQMQLALAVADRPAS
jgi:hypothetical protein